MATVYLLSTENLQRDPDELAALIEIITEVVEEICAPANHWSVRTVGDLSSCSARSRPGGCVRRWTPRPAARRSMSTSRWATAAASEIVDAVRALLDKELANGATAEELIDAVTVEAISENLYTSGQPDPIW